MSQVFVLDSTKQALNPVHPGRARLLLKQGRAAVYRRFPFTIMLKHAVEQPALHPLRIKVDPGSKTTGIALVNDASGEVVWAAALTHRGEQIQRDLDKRRATRRNRRQRKTRYRAPRFQNRRKRKGTLPPSQTSRICNVVTWVCRLMQLCPITAISQELVRFDTQALAYPAIEGVEYQHGTLAGYEVREYILLKWNHQCAYCLTPVKGHHLSGEQSPTFYGNESMLNVLPAPRKGGRDHSITPRQGGQWLQQAGEPLRAISTWRRLDCFNPRTERDKARLVGSW